MNNTILLITIIIIVLVVLLTTQKKSHEKFLHGLGDDEYWPPNFYSHNYRENRGEMDLPGIYTRNSYWYPGFITSGWGEYNRPSELSNSRKFPRNRWLRNNTRNYLINNRSLTNSNFSYYY